MKQCDVSCAPNFRLGLFDNPYKNCDTDREKRDILTSAHRDAARAMAQRSIVLLKNNDNLLPLSRSAKDYCCHRTTC